MTLQQKLIENQIWWSFTASAHNPQVTTTKDGFIKILGLRSPKSQRDPPTSLKLTKPRSKSSVIFSLFFSPLFPLFPCLFQVISNYCDNEYKLLSQSDNSCEDLCRVHTAVGKLEREDAAFMQVKLVFVRLGVVEHLHVAAFHAHSQPFSSGTVAQ